MRRNGEDEQERQVLLRIVAVLFALARLMEGVASLPHPVRQVILFLLRPCESRVRRFIIGMEPELSAVYSMEQGTSVDDALELAARFAELGQWLTDMINDPVFGWGGHDLADLPDILLALLTGGPRMKGAVRRYARWSAPAPDT